MKCFKNQSLSRTSRNFHWPTHTSRGGEVVARRGIGGSRGSLFGNFLDLESLSQAAVSRWVITSTFSSNQLRWKLAHRSSINDVGVGEMLQEKVHCS